MARVATLSTRRHRQRHRQRASRGLALGGGGGGRPAPGAAPGPAPGRPPGPLVPAGTGSIVIGRDARGRWARAGGLGPLLGDEGSAFWLGRGGVRGAGGGG